MSWLKKISDAIDTAINGIRPPAPTIPPILLMCEIMNRPGLSAISLATSIISRFPEIGLQTGVNPDGSANKMLLLVKVMSEEIVKEIQTNAVVMCAMQPGAFSASGVATVAGMLPAAVEVTNSGFMETKGIVF